MLLKAIQYFIVLTALFLLLLFTQNPVFRETEELNCTAVCDLRDIHPFLCTSMYPILTAGTKGIDCNPQPQFVQCMGSSFSVTDCFLSDGNSTHLTVLAVSEWGSFEKCFKIVFQGKRRQ